MNRTTAPNAAARLSSLAKHQPAVVAHRGDSRNHPENTLPAFAAATALGAPVQEFDVQSTSCGALVCLHDATLDRTTDAKKVLGPGARIADFPLARAQQLDAGAWKGAAHAGARIPTLEQALAVMLPKSLPMIEHKAGTAEQFVAELRRMQVVDDVLLQSFDWTFVEAVGRLEPRLALGLLGPTTEHEHIDAAVIEAARHIGACFVHWHAAELTRAEIERAHSAGLLVVTYTSDDELSWHGGRAVGVDAMCSNDPGAMLQSLKS
ncbi:MAG: glycerophosphodiester phosphodiesterase family protein [Planctomycetota bacterium]